MKIKYLFLFAAVLITFASAKLASKAQVAMEQCDDQLSSLYEEFQWPTMFKGTPVDSILANADSLSAFYAWMDDYGQPIDDNLNRYAKLERMRNGFMLTTIIIGFLGLTIIFSSLSKYFYGTQ